MFTCCFFLKTYRIIQLFIGLYMARVGGTLYVVRVCLAHNFCIIAYVRTTAAAEALTQLSFTHIFREHTRIIVIEYVLCMY